MKQNKSLQLTPAQIALLHDDLLELSNIVSKVGVDNHFNATEEWLRIINELNNAVSLLDQDVLRNTSHFSETFLPSLSKIPKKHINAIKKIADEAVNYVCNAPNSDKVITFEIESDDSYFDTLSLSDKNLAELGEISIAHTIMQIHKQPNALKAFHMNIDFSMNALKKLLPEEKTALEEIATKHQKLLNPLTRLRYEKRKATPEKELVATAIDSLRQFIKSYRPRIDDENTEPTTTREALKTITESLDKAEATYDEALKVLKAQRSR